MSRGKKNGGHRDDLQIENGLGLTALYLNNTMTIDMDPFLRSITSARKWTAA